MEVTGGIKKKKCEDINKIIKTVDSSGRQVWNKNVFAEKAMLRQYNDGKDPGFDFLDMLDPDKMLKMNEGLNLAPVERRHLESRTKPVAIESELGKSKIITPFTPKEHQGGFWCATCQCLCKDSQTYFDHINGKRHNRQLGMTMTVEKVNVDEVRDKLMKIKEKQIKDKLKEDTMDIYGLVEKQLEEAEENEEQLKLEKRQKRKERKEKKKKKKEAEEKTEDNEKKNSDNPVNQQNELLKTLFPGCNIEISELELEQVDQT